MSRSDLYDRIYRLVERVPFGRVTTYGRVARMVGGCSPRQVGYALASLPEGNRVPWHRVVNRLGEISRRSDGVGDDIQRRMLETEGVRFDERGRLDLARCLWDGPAEEPGESG